MSRTIYQCPQCGEEWSKPHCPQCAEEREAHSMHRPGSEAKPTNIAEWFRYLTETGNFNAYWCDGSANCKRIEAGFAAWKAAQGEKSKPLNSVLSDPCKESETINPNKK